MTKRAFCMTLLLSGFLLGGCAPGPGSESTGEFIDSSATTARVKASLVDALGARAISIQVKTWKDEVQLSGFVNSSLLKQRAGSVTARVPGVKRVINDLVVKQGQ
ncbi:lipoprotein [Legionella geestiana]|uniref:Lipoprotein n=1 Tax=Legionella geestiana TaxID=45065 RepID=A0A0W0TWL6_9GAMM|nr:BON domain-containing protein [Legionella geestiana]KTC99706.1 lipoprotein [Legionella geestiana]QBS13171.1 BON domain-containing protein [Legionella geestiana]STX54309.1 lipoprotein [Legionella geestiana]